MISNPSLERGIKELISELELPTSERVKVGEHTEEYPNYMTWKNWISETVEDFEDRDIPENIARVNTAREEILTIGRAAAKYLATSGYYGIKKDTLLALAKSHPDSIREAMTGLEGLSGGLIPPIFEFAEEVGIGKEVTVPFLASRLNSLEYHRLYALKKLDESAARTATNRVYDDLVSQGKVTYHSLCAIAYNELRDYKFEDLPHVLDVLATHPPEDVMGDLKIEGIFSMAYDGGNKPEVVDLIISSLLEGTDQEKATKSRWLMPALGQIADDRAIDYLIKTIQKGGFENYMNCDSAIHMAAKKGSRKALEYIGDPKTVYQLSRESRKGVIRSAFSVVRRYFSK